MSEKTIFTCSACDAQSPKWSGRCLNCGKWGTLAETSEGQGAKGKGQKFSLDAKKFNQKKLVDFNTIAGQKFERVKTKMAEIDQIMGGGIVPGSLILLGGEPGIGKSTLVLQILKQLDNGTPLLYCSGEESAQQIKLRVDRLNYKPQNLRFFGETNIEEVCAAIHSFKPQLAVVDSIQTVYSNEVESEAGNVSQIRACTVKLLEAAKTTNTAVILVGHVTKDGTMAGPKTLEHLVDVVLYLEGDKYQGFRLLRSSKNRFGSTNEIGVLEMTEQGLEEVKNPAKSFLSATPQNLPGSVVSCFVEGNRAFLVEVQALVTPTIFGYPQRKTSGYDLNRLQMISAVLFKRASLNLNNQDIHLNIVGGFKVTEPAIDLAVALAITSALRNVPLPQNTLAIGELGLGGEIRPVQNLEKRIYEAQKLGFTNIIAPDTKLQKEYTVIIQRVKHISEAIKSL